MVNAASIQNAWFDLNAVSNAGFGAQTTAANAILLYKANLHQKTLTIYYTPNSSAVDCMPLTL